MSLKNMCDRCGKITHGHKLYFGRFVAIDALSVWNAGSTWYKKRKDICFDCYTEFEKWLDNKE